MIDIAIFRTARVSLRPEEQVPHKGGPLSEGIVHGKQVTCPLHGWNFISKPVEAVAPDVGCARRYPVKVEDGQDFS